MSGSVESPIHPRRLTVYGAWLGLGMIGLAWLWVGVIQGRDLRAWFPAAHWRGDLLLGSLVGAVFAAGVWRLFPYIPAFERMEQMFYATLDMGALRFRHAALYGLLAGIPEEILFRGAIQPALGLVVTSLIFGALHAVTLSYFAYAALASLLLGGLAEWRHGLWAPTAAHTMIDAIMFTLLIRRWRKSQSGRDISAG